MFETPINPNFQAPALTAGQQIFANGVPLPYTAAEYGYLHRHSTSGHSEETGAQVWLRDYLSDGSKGSKTLIGNIEVGDLKLTIKPTRHYALEDSDFDRGYNLGK